VTLRELSVGPPHGFFRPIETRACLRQLAVLRRHCDAAGRDYGMIEKTHVQRWLLARDATALAAKSTRLVPRGSSTGFSGTVSEAIDLIGQYRDAGIDLLIQSDGLHDVETRELFVSEIMPHFA